MTGCSLIFVHGPPSPPIPRTPEVDCTRSVAAPVVDLIFGVAWAAAGIALLSVRHRPGEEGVVAGIVDFEHVVGGISAGFAAFSIGSSIYGFVKTGSCRDARIAQQREPAPPVEEGN